MLCIQPQGSALSCTLFLVYINDLTKHLNVSKALFTDDLVIWASGKYPILARTKLNRALLNIFVFCNLKSKFTSPKASKRTYNLEIDGHFLEK